MRVAIFGGTFDPIHSAHLNVAEEAAEAFALDRVLFIPAANPPHKAETRTPFEHRYRMVELACQRDPRFVASRLEEGQTKSYSYYTILKVRETLQPGDALFFLIGADAFAEIDSWHRADEVAKMVDFIVVTRPGHEYGTPHGCQVHPLESLSLEVSSSDIRQKLSRGEAVMELPAAVYEYVRAHRLYQV